MSINPRQTSVLVVAAVTALSWLVPKAATAQTKGCEPVAERAGREFGGFITAREELGPLPGHSSFYWHIDAFTTRAAAETARARRSTVVESLGSLWLFAIAEAAWRPATGERIASVGPLPLVKADAYAAVYMEGVFRPGMRSPIHRHPGGRPGTRSRANNASKRREENSCSGPGGGGCVPAGLPMMLTGTGSGPRRSLVLILQDAAQPRSTLATDWAPAGLCRS